MPSHQSLACACVGPPDRHGPAHCHRRMLLRQLPQGRRHAAVDASSTGRTGPAWPDAFRNASQGSRQHRCRTSLAARVAVVQQGRQPPRPGELLQYAAFLEFSGGHWLSLYGLLWPASTRPAVEMRTMVSDLADASALPDDVPNLKTRSLRFYARLMKAWIAMGFRSPRIEVAGDSHV